MTQAVEVEMIGGPHDGQRRAIQCDDPMRPPDEVQFSSVSPSFSWTATTGAIVPTQTIVYRRTPSDRESGPLWLYRFHAAS